MSDTMTKFSCRTGHHTRREGDVYRVHDGPSFIGFFKCVRDDTDKLIERPATAREHDQHVLISLARQGYTHKAEHILKNASEYDAKIVEKALVLCKESRHVEYRLAAEEFEALRRLCESFETGAE